jgi:eukaryotic-like serine/threonine-protein kinase
MLTSGTRLGPYEILSPIGAGGMGEVYRARDTRLGREVAVKILPAEFAHDAKLRTRFEREAKTISQLSHPNICTLFDVGEDYIVMELLEGESLADRLARGPSPLSEVLKYGVQICEALGKAHREGVVHRDLKPGNIMIAKNGANLLDFGLAKSVVVAGTPDGPTAQKPLTQEGVVLGTLQYMAPEQLAGEEPDARTDIFALGAVLYEMATGKRAFEGKTKTSLIGAIVSGEPRPMHELQPLTPPALEHVVRKCMAKDPDDRWQNASDIAEELRWIGEAGSQAGLAVPAGHERSSAVSKWVTVAIAGWVLLAIATSAAILYVRHAGRGSRMLQMEISGSDVTGAGAGPFGLSPDGSLLACVVANGNELHLWLRNMRTAEGRVLNGTGGAMYPFWSPDSKSIGFFANGKLKTINVDSGAVLVVCDAPEGRRGAWSSRGVIIFAPNVGTALYKVPASGGPAVAVTKLPADVRGWSHRNPYFLPDGEHFLFASFQLFGDKPRGTTLLGSLDGMAERAVLDYPTTVAYSDGQLFSVRNGTLLVQPFDVATGKVTGSARAIVHDIDSWAPRADAAIAAAGDLLVYRPAVRRRVRLTVADRRGKVEQIGDPGTCQRLNVSPDGRAVTFERFEMGRGEFDLVLINFASGAEAVLTSSGTAGQDTAVFSPDSSRLAIATQGEMPAQIAIQPLDGGSRELLWKGNEDVWAYDWSHDANIIFCVVQHAATNYNLAYLRMNNDRQLVDFLRSSAAATSPSLSPNERWVAYESYEGGTGDIYVVSFPSGAPKWKVSNGGGYRPRWSADGRILYYLSHDIIQAVDVRDENSFVIGRPHAVTGLRGVADFGLTNDGRIVALCGLGETAPPVKVVLNWRELISPR